MPQAPDDARMLKILAGLTAWPATRSITPIRFSTSAVTSSGVSRGSSPDWMLIRGVVARTLVGVAAGRAGAEAAGATVDR